MSKIRYWLKRLFGMAWVVRRCRFPYPNGYATYLPSKNMTLDTGLTKEYAQMICDEMNEVTK